MQKEEFVICGKGSVSTWFKVPRKKSPMDASIASVRGRPVTGRRVQLVGIAPVWGFPSFDHTHCSIAV